jgi:ubiquinone/menaquinone biosynthesis C-methylase UbiE
MQNSRAKKDLAITGLMAKWYNKSARSRIGSLQKLADEIASIVPNDAKVVEVAPGPGYLSIELAKRGFNVTGLELSADFVEIEKKNAADAGVTVSFKQGNAAAIPLSEETADFVVCMAAFKNFSEPQTAINEMYRVIKPGGSVLVIDMNRENTAADIEEEMRNMAGLNPFDRWFIKWSFKTFLKKGAYNYAEFEMFAANTHCKSSNIEKRGTGFYVWLKK